MQYHWMFFSLIVLAACSRGSRSAAPVGGKNGSTSGFRLESPDFREGEAIPKVHAYKGEGDNIPPRLAWSGLPSKTVELALIVDDPDAPTPEPWVHDVLYHIPPDAAPQDMVTRKGREGTFTAGVNSWNEPGWGGPKPPPGKPHRYFFRLYALDAHVNLAPGATKKQLQDAMKGHVLGEAVYMGTYQR